MNINQIDNINNKDIYFIYENEKTKHTSFNKECSILETQQKVNEEALKIIQELKERIKEQLSLGKDLFNWDLSLTENISLKDFIYSKFIGILYDEIHKKDGYFLQDTETNILDALYNFTIKKPKKSTVFYNQFRVVDEINKTSKELVDSKQNQLINHDKKIFKNWFLLIGKSFEILIKELEKCREDQNSLIDEITEESIKKSKRSNHGKNTKRIIDLDKTKKEIKKNFDALNKFQKSLDKFIITSKNNCGNLINLLDDLIYAEMGWAIQGKMTALSLKEKLNIYKSSVTQNVNDLKEIVDLCIKDCQSSIPKSVGVLSKDLKEGEVIFSAKKNEEGKIVVTEYTKKSLKAKEDRDNEIELAVDLSLKQWNSVDRNLNHFKSIVDQYVDYVDTQIDDLIETLGIKEKSQKDLSDCWFDEEFITPKKLKKISKEDDISVEKSIVTEEINIVEDKALKPEVKPKKSSEELIQISLEKYTFSKKQLIERNNSSFSVIHKFNHLLAESLLSTTVEGVPTEWGDLMNLECKDHLALLGCGFELFLQVMLDNRLAALPVVVKVFLDAHILLEQLMQKEYVAQYGDIYKENHRLSDLLEKTSLFKKLEDSSKLMTLINDASLWTRYPKYFEQKYPEETKRPEVLNAILFSLEISKLLENGSVKLTKDQCKKLKDLTECMFSTLTMTYQCLFQYIDAHKEKNLQVETMKSWIGFLANGKQTLLKHLDNQAGKTLKWESSSSLKETSQNLKTTLESVEKTIGTCSVMQNVKMRVEEANGHIRSILAGLDLFSKYDKPILNAFHERNLLGTQWTIEQFLKATCSLKGVTPPDDTHNFSQIQKLIINTSSNDKYTENLKKMSEEAKYFNIKIGYNYFRLYEDSSNECLKIFKNTLQIFSDYVELDVSRNEIEEDEFNTMATRASAIITMYAHNVINDLTMAHKGNERN